MQYVTDPTSTLKRAAIETAWARAFGRKVGGGRRRGGRGNVMLAGMPIGDAPQACVALGLEPTSIYSSLRRGYVMVAVPLAWEFPNDDPRRRVWVSREGVLPPVPPDRPPVARGVSEMPVLWRPVRRKPHAAAKETRREPERPEAAAGKVPPQVSVKSWERRHNH